MGYRLNRLDESVFIAVSKPLLTEFGIHHRLESCVAFNLASYVASGTTEIQGHRQVRQGKYGGPTTTLRIRKQTYIVRLLTRLFSLIQILRGHMRPWPLYSAPMVRVWVSEGSCPLDGSTSRSPASPHSELEQRKSKNWQNRSGTGNRGSRISIKR